MAMNATARRRWFGALILLAAVAMLVLGETALRGRLGSLGFMVYWLVCLLLTGTAMLVALLDAWILRRQSQERARQLLQTTLHDIEAEARSRRRTKPRGRIAGRD